MLAIRLSRTGAKNRPAYRVVVAETRTARDSRVVENVGYYDPKLRPAVLKLDRARIAHWIQVGARPSATVKSLLKSFKEPAAEAGAEASATAP
ncbi:MAG: 30S ribosomal protein S16 [Acidobacteriota bacterium]